MTTLIAQDVHAGESRHLDDLDDFLTVVAEPYKALRTTDGNNPVSGEIYVRMCALLKFVEENSFSTPTRSEPLELNAQEYSVVKTAVEDRWDMLHS